MAVDIKHLADYSDKLRNVSNIVTETVGTTTSYTFPEDTLHPYIKRNLKEYIVNHWEDEEIQEMVNALRKQAKTEVAEGWVGAVSIPEGDDVDVKEVKEAVAEYALNQIDGSDLEVLKNRIVKDGYSKGQLQGHLFPDVLPAFKKWIAEGKKIFMYSSGLEMSQKYLVSNSVEGDITELISGCFYSSEFPRTRSESFREMCKKVDCSADKVAFLTDNAQTARAAHKAGLVVIMLCREGNSYVGSSIRESFPVINSFEDISQHICGKRKMSGEDSEDTCGKKPKLDEGRIEEKEDKPTMPINITVTPPEEETGAAESEEKKDEAAEEKMEVDDKDKVDNEDVSEAVSEVKEDTSKVEEVEKEEPEVEAMETDGKVSGDKLAEENKSEEKVKVESIKEPEVNAEESAEDKDEKKVEEVAKDGAEEKAEEKVEESETEVKTQDETKEKDVAESKEAEKEEKADEATESKSEETKPEAKSEEDVEKKSEEVEERTEETIEEKKSEEEVVKSEEVEKKSEEVSVVKSVEGQSEDEKPAEGADEVKNNVDEKSSDEVIKENGEAEKEVCSNGIDGEETKENGVSSDDKVEAIKAVPKKAELEGSANEAATQESA